MSQTPSLVRDTFLIGEGLNGPHSPSELDRDYCRGNGRLLASAVRGTAVGATERGPGSVDHGASQLRRLDHPALTPEAEQQADHPLVVMGAQRDAQAIACDLIIASDRSSFGLPEVRLGLVPGAGGAFRLARQVPLKVAMGYLLTGRNMTARQAFELGLVNEVAPAAELDECVDRWVAELLRSAPLAVRAVKEAVMRSLDMPLPDAFTTPFPQEQRRRTSRDAREGPRAFVEKREPGWEGR